MEQRVDEIDGNMSQNIDQLLSIIQLLLKAHEGENLSREDTIAFVDFTNRSTEPFIKHSVRETQLVYQKGVDCNTNPAKFSNYANLLKNKVRQHLLSLALGLIEQAFELISLHENQASIKRQKDRLVHLRKLIANERMRQFNDQFHDNWFKCTDGLQRNQQIAFTLVNVRNFLQRWSDYISNENKVIRLRGLDLSEIDFSGLDVTIIDFARCTMRNAILRNIEYQPEQFVEVADLFNTRSDPVILQAIFDEKLARVKSSCQYLRKIIDEKRALINALQLLNHLVCRGEPPKLDHLSDADFEIVVRLALGSPYINILPDNNKYFIANIGTKLNLEVELASRSNAEHILAVILEERQYHINPLNIALVQDVQRYNYLADVSTFAQLLEDVEKVYFDLPYATTCSDPNDSLSLLLNELRELRRIIIDLKKTRAQLDQHFTQNLVNKFLECIFSEHDAVLEGTPEERLMSALDSARGKNDVVVDLTSIDLSLLKLDHDIDFSDVFVKLLPEQFVALRAIHHEQRYSRLIRAIENDDIADVNLCLSHGLDVNWTNEAGRTPFMVACFKNRLRIARLMLENHGANLMQKSKSGWTIIESVARLKLLQMVRLLTEFGGRLDFTSAVYLNSVLDEDDQCLFSDAEVQSAIDSPDNGSDYSGDYPLHIATKSGFHGLMRWLIVRGANLTVLNGSKMTALDIAAQKGDRTAVELLLINNAPLSARTIRFACENKFLDIAKMLNSIATTNPDLQVNLDLYSAIYLDQPWNVIAKLIGNDCNTEQPDGLTPLAIACRLGKLPIVKKLITLGANLYIPSKQSLPLSHALQEGQLDVIEYIVLEQGVSPYAVIKGFTPPFFEAVIDGNTNGALILMNLRLDGNRVIDVNATYLNRTALLMAAHNGNADIVAALLEAGADPFTRDVVGNTPLHLATLAGHECIVALLSQAMLQPRNGAGLTPLQLAEKANNKPIIDMLKLQSHTQSTRSRASSAEQLGRFGIMPSPRDLENDNHASTKRESSYKY